MSGAARQPDRSPDPAQGGRIGLVACLAFAVGTMVGGGVFTLSGTAIDEAGPAALLSYALAGVVMFLSALSFVAIAARAKPGDSGYGPVGDILGPVWRFVVMWGFYLNGLTIITFLVVSFGQYLNGYFLPGLGPLAAALIVTTALVALNLGPADLVGKTEVYVVAAKIGILAFFAIWGLTRLGDADFTPFAPNGTGSVFRVSALLFTAYTGFNVVTNMAGSVKRPERTVPIAVMGSILISAAVYVGVILAMLASGVEHFGPTGVSQAAEALMGHWGALLIAFAACLSTLSGANANLLGASEIMLRLVVQQDVPPAAGRTTSHGHPYVSVGLIGAITLVLILVSDIDNIVVYANVGALVSMIVVNVAAFRLASQGWPGEGFRLPGGVAIPMVAIVSCLGQFPSLGWPEALIGLLLVAAGLPLFLARHRPEWGAEVVGTVLAAIHSVEAAGEGDARPRAVVAWPLPIEPGVTATLELGPRVRTRRAGSGSCAPARRRRRPGPPPAEAAGLGADRAGPRRRSRRRTGSPGTARSGRGRSPARPRRRPRRPPRVPSPSCRSWRSPRRRAILRCIAPCSRSPRLGRPRSPAPTT